MKKVVIFTDTWLKNISGVVTSIMLTKKGLEEKGYKVFIIHPEQFSSFPLPYYHEIRMAFLPQWKMKKMLSRIKPDYIHIATEGTLGLAARMICLAHHWKFTSSYHTRLPEYVAVRVSYLKKPTYNYLRWFHSKSQNTIVSTDSMKKNLEKHHFKNVSAFPLGIDLKLFKRNPRAKTPRALKHPIFVFLGRVSPEKNLRAFLNCKLPGTKLIIGDGPEKEELEEEFGHEAVFVGYKKGKALVNLLSVCDVLVFPSKTDTFGLAMIEALACGLPVAAYDVQGPNNIISNGIDGYLGNNLNRNAKNCLKLKRSDCRKSAMKYSRTAYVKNFIASLVPI
ncbi:MAG: glycosyltransferase family 1 protein [bacterium]|nr:glycosyltransferase family 1 protein [bacterium]